LLATELRARAEQVVARAETMKDADAQQKMRRTAESYEKLAQRLEQESGKPGKVSANAEIIAEGAPERFAKILRRLDEPTPPKEHAGGTAPSRFLGFSPSSPASSGPPERWCATAS